MCISVITGILRVLCEYSIEQEHIYGIHTYYSHITVTGDYSVVMLLEASQGSRNKGTFNGGIASLAKALLSIRAKPLMRV